MAVRLRHILQRFQSHLGEDDTLATWCTEHLGRPALIQVGNEPTDDPTMWRVPAVVMVPERRDAGQAVEEHRGVIFVECRLQAEGITPDSGEPRPVRAYDGVYLLDEFSEEVAAALARALSGTPVDLDILGETMDTQEFYPVMVADIRVTVTIPVYMGGEITLE